LYIENNDFALSYKFKHSQLATVEYLLLLSKIFVSSMVQSSLTLGGKQQIRARNTRLNFVCGATCQKSLMTRTTWKWYSC